MSRLADRTFGGLLWTAAGTAGQSVVSILVTLILARLLTPTDFGLMGAALVVVSFARIATQLGVAPAIVQRPELSPRHVGAGAAVSVVAGLVLGVVVAAAAPSLAGFFRMPDLEPLVRVLAWAFPLAGVAVPGMALLQREMKFRVLARIQVVSFVLGYGAVGVAAAWAGAGVWALVAAHLGQVTLRSALVAQARPEALAWTLALREAGQLLRFGLGLSLARFANTFAQQADNLVVGRLLGAEELGAYGRSYQMMMVPTNLIGTVLDKVLFPALASVQDDAARMGRAHLRTVGAVVMITAPLAALLVVVSADLIPVLLGPGWEAAVAPFAVLIAFLPIRSAYKVNDALVRAAGAVYRHAVRQAIYAAAVLFGATVGGLAAGLTGVATGVGAAIALNFVMTARLATRVTGASGRALAVVVARHASIGAAVAALAWGVRAALLPAAPPMWLLLVVTTSVGAVAWGMVFVVAPTLFGPERAAVPKLLAYVRSRLLGRRGGGS